MLLHVACYALVLLWGLQAGFCTLLWAPFPRARCSEGEKRGQQQWACKQDPIAHPSQEILGMGKAE